MLEIDEPWVWLTRELLESDAWRSLSINARRFVDFLLVEHTGKGGAKNGLLIAPYAQLERYGVGARHMADAIREAEGAGLVVVNRPGRRCANRYALGWLAAWDGTPAANLWRDPTSEGRGEHPEIQKSTRKREGRWPESTLKSTRKREGAY